MDFSTLFKKKDNPREYYFGLFLRSDSAVGFIFEMIEGKASLVAKELKKFSNGWEGVIDDIDELLAILESETGIHVTQSIYFVYSYFIDQSSGEIREPYKKVIKSISKELELKPLGYIECHEAVKTMLEKKDASPLNGILLELDTSHASLYIFKGGKMIHNDQIPRTDSLIDDLTEMFNKKKDHYLLPSRVTMYGSSNLSAESELIKEHSWPEDLFIQAPRVFTIKSEELLTGLGQTFMSQMEQENPVEQLEKEEERDPLAELIEEEAEEKKVEPKQSRKKESASPVVHDDESEPDEAEKMGFLIGGDITDDPNILPPKAATAASVMPISNPFAGFTLPSFSFPAISLPTTGTKGFVIVGAVLLIIGSAGAIEYIFHSARISIALPSEKISDSYNLEAPINTSIGSQLSVAKKTVQLELTDKVATSGKREVGEKAKGTVILNNLELRSITYPAGTKMTVDGKTFTLDSEVTIGSASSNFNSRQAQTKEANVTAEAIGSEYNISDDKQMSIEGASSGNIAVSKGAFSGGKKEELRTVATKDIDSLEDRVLKKGKESSNTEISKQLKSTEKLIENLTEVAVDSSEYTGEVGEEADEVSITAQVNIEYYVYDEDQLQKELISKLGKEVPQGFQIGTGNVTYKLQEANKNKDDDGVTLEIRSDAKAVKQVEQERIIKRITGKTITSAKQIIQDEFEAERVDIEKNASPLLVFNSMLPFHAKKIEIEFISN